MAIEIKKAFISDVNVIAPLFDAYRMFYSQSPDLAAAEKFISERLANNESVIFIAFDGSAAIGFVQLYPIFSSVGLKRAWLLNDMFVAGYGRGKGAAKALLNAAQEYGRQTNSGWLMLQTATDNIIAQKLYEKNGWVKDERYLVYNYIVN